MKDIQNLRDDRRINIRKVGVKTISYPVTVLDKEHRLQQTVATVNMYVNLPHRFKGTHMSRFVEILNRFHGRINLESFHHILEETKGRLDAEAAHMEIEFPYFLQRDSSVDSIGTERYECRMHGSLAESDDLVLEIDVPITVPRSSLDQGGLPRSMGRWGTARVAVRFREFIWIEDLISLVEQGLAGRSDLPDSVETVCRQLGEILADQPAIRWFSVVVENFASGFATFASVNSSNHTSSTRKNQ
ncbi:GTP cyclohydrolase FolE2 [Desulfolithobacter dissulfuricans]|uniref:GTP cyclohydrolase FolE2 n=1 Tax=Desulfolithobacter dissulfuricans TaxID=2795293 RepID=A0A915UA35_9BACT|nr:GTP cyclohydrolase I FolE2 [Desulfolithobacter dissulfuricans]BCO09576.1 GTP cyclohydrolase FolE2 [Desulfolithobacter dissulfuricans]